MLDLSYEIESLRPLLGDARTDALLARERREVFSVEPELRLAAWGGAMLVATAAGLVLKNNLHRIGPLALAAAIAAVAAGCYAWAWRHRERDSVADAAILLLGALLVSGDAAFIESQWHLFGAAWHRHFALVALLHGIAAYAYRSRALLSLSIAALAAFFGIGGDTAGVHAARFFIAAAIVLVWRALDRVIDFAPVFEHFAANLAAGGALALIAGHHTRIAGCATGIAAGAAIVAWGFRTRRESFVLYGFAYAVIALDILILNVIGDGAAGFVFVVLSVIAAVAALFALHARVQERRS